MSYVVINKYPVFLYSSKIKNILADAFAHKAASWRVASVISGTKESKEKQETICNYLIAKYKDSPEQFYSEWVKFNVIDEEAKGNVTDLLYDYCDYYGNSYLKDRRDFTERTFQDYSGSSYEFPLGFQFDLIHSAKSFKKWVIFGKRHERRICIGIDVRDVFQLSGDLKEFQIRTHSYEIFFAGKMK